MSSELLKAIYAKDPIARRNSSFIEKIKTSVIPKKGKVAAREIQRRTLIATQNYEAFFESVLENFGLNMLPASNSKKKPVSFRQMSLEEILRTARECTVQSKRIKIVQELNKKLGQESAPVITKVLSGIAEQKVIQDKAFGLSLIHI